MTEPRPRYFGFEPDQVRYFQVRLPAFAATSIELDGKSVSLKYAVQPECTGNILLLTFRDTAEALVATVTYEATTRSAKCEKAEQLCASSSGNRKSL